MSGTLDMGLKEQALSLGVEILFNHRLDKFDGKAIVGMKAGLKIQTATMKTAHVYGAGATRKLVHNNSEEIKVFELIYSSITKE